MGFFFFWVHVLLEKPFFLLPWGRKDVLLYLLKALLFHISLSGPHGSDFCVQCERQPNFISLYGQPTIPKSIYWKCYLCIENPPSTLECHSCHKSRIWIWVYFWAFYSIHGSMCPCACASPTPFQSPQLYNKVWRLVEQVLPHCCS